MNQFIKHIALTAAGIVLFGGGAFAGNTAVIKQSGGGTATVIQSGKGNTAHIVQEDSSFKSKKAGTRKQRENRHKGNRA